MTPSSSLRRGAVAVLPALLFAVLLAAAPSLRAIDAVPEGGRWYHQESEDGGCVVESHDPIFSASAVALLEKLGAQLLPSQAPAPAPVPEQASVPPLPATRLLLRVETAPPGTPPAPPVLAVRRYREAGRDRVDFQITVWAGPGVTADAWQRLAVEAFLRRRAQALGAPPPEIGAPLDPLPLWIAEGAFQNLRVVREKAAFDDGQADLFTRIGKRAAFLGTAPAAAEVEGWSALSDDPVLSAWRQAFCWELYLFYQSDAERSARLDRWFVPGIFASAEGKVSPRVEAQWKAFQKTVGRGMGEVLYSWDRTAGEVAAIRTFLLPGDDKAKPPVPPMVIPWTGLPAVVLKRDPRLPGAIQAKTLALQLLEMKANFAWRPVIALYRDAFGALGSGMPWAVPPSAAGTETAKADPGTKGKETRASLPSWDGWNPEKHIAEFQRRLALADQAALRLTGLDRRVEDYLNWFEVTRRTRGGLSPFADYFNLNGGFEVMEERSRQEGFSATVPASAP